jgi:hypothetical protein
MNIDSRGHRVSLLCARKIVAFDEDKVMEIESWANVCEIDVKPATGNQCIMRCSNVMLNKIADYYSALEPSEAPVEIGCELRNQS